MSVTLCNWGSVGQIGACHAPTPPGVSVSFLAIPRLTSTTDGRTEEIACGGMFVAIGHTPNTDFLAGQVELDDKGYVRWTIPQRTNTTVDGVFAAGDVGDSY